MLLDLEDYAKFKDITIYYVEGGYPQFNNGGEREYVHRFITGAGEKDVVDHKNKDILDNRKENLRLTTHVFNHANTDKYNLENPTSKYKGVVFDKANGNWVSRVVLNQKHYYQGRYSDEKSAALAYNYYAKKAFGEFAHLNDVQGGDNIEWTKNKLTRELVKEQSGYRYVSWDNHSKKWNGHVRKEGKQIKVKSSSNVIECLLSVNDFIIKHELHLLKRYPKRIQEISEKHISEMCGCQMDRYENQLDHMNRRVAS